MTATHYPQTDPRESRLPHAWVLAVALLLGLVAAWCWMSGLGGADSDAAPLALREQVAEDRGEYLRIARQAATARSRLLEAQQRLEAFAHERFDELHHAADVQSSAGEQDRSPAEPDDSNVAAPPSAQQLEAVRLRDRLTELERERGRLLERLTVEHPLVRDVDSQIADLRRQIAELPQLVETPPPAAHGNQSRSERQARERLKEQWQGLVDEAVAGSQQLEQDCRRIEQELAVSEAQRAKAEKNYLASAEVLASGAASPSAHESGSSNWGLVLLICAFGVPLLAIARRSVVQSISKRGEVIREVGDLERLFDLPVIGLIAAGETGIALPANSQGRHAVPLVLQILAALLVFLLVAMTVQNPAWLMGMASHPIDAFRQALGNLGGR
jgi:hypothetical protein